MTAAKPAVNGIVKPTIFSRPAVYVIAFGLVASVFLAVMLDFYSEQGRRDYLEIRSIERVDAIEHRLTEAVSTLKAIRGFFAASGFVTRQEFQTFVRSLEIGDSVQAFEWIPRVPLDRRERFEAAARKDGIEDFIISERQAQGQMAPAGSRPVYYPVFYVEPMQGNEAAIGFDLGSNPARLAALQQARKNGRAVATSRIVLVQETGGQYGFLVFLPIYNNAEGAIGSLVRSPEQLAGFALGVFRIGNLVKGALQGFAPFSSPAQISIFDMSAAPGQRRLYPKGAPERDSAAASSFYFSRTIDVAGRSWKVAVTAPVASLFSIARWQTWSVAAAGIVMTLLIAHLISLSLQASQANMLRTHALELERSAIALKRTNLELDHFSHAASHDLQEPLRKLVSFSDLLEIDVGAELTDDARTDLKEIKSAANRMKTLVQDLLALSTTGHIPMSLETVSVADCAEQAIRDLQLKIEESQASIEMDALPTLHADRPLLTQLYQNLISNALKFTRDGVTPIIRLTAETAGSGIVLGVQDNGIGVEPEFAEKIFEPFRRLHGRSEYEGSGIGLAICTKVVERHSGRIWVESESGQGSHFRFTLQSEMGGTDG